MIGQTLGHYRVLEKVAAGGMGVVYRTRDEQLDRDVAVKVLPSVATTLPRRHFRKEAMGYWGTFLLGLSYLVTVRHLLGRVFAMNPLPTLGTIRLGIACTALLAASAVAARAEEVTKSFAVTGRANVRVETNDGSVRLPRAIRTSEFASNTMATSWERTSASTPVKMETRSS